MGGLPDALFLVDSTQEEIAIQEAKRLGIPVVCIVDTNSCPDDIDYLIPANDDAKRALALYLKGIGDALEVSVQDAREKAAAREMDKPAKKTAEKKSEKTEKVEKLVTAEKAETKVEAKPVKATRAKKTTEKSEETE